MALYSNYSRFYKDFEIINEREEKHIIPWIAKSIQMVDVSPGPKAPEIQHLENTQKIQSEYNKRINDELDDNLKEFYEIYNRCKENYYNNERDFFILYIALFFFIVFMIYYAIHLIPGE